MKKKILFIFLAVSLLCSSGCDGGSRFKTVSTYTDMKIVYDVETNIVYYRASRGLSPFYSEDGNLCQYLDGEICEMITIPMFIKEEDIDND